MTLIASESGGGAAVLRQPILEATQAATQTPMDSNLSAERVASLYAHLPTALLSNAAGAFVVTLLFWSQVSRRLLGSWLVVFTAWWLWRAAVGYRYSQRRAEGLAPAQRWYRAWAIGTVGSGALWGLAVWLLYGHGGATERIGLLLSVFGFCIGAVPIFSLQRRVFNAFTLLCFVPMVVRVAVPGSFDAYTLAGVLLIIFGLTVTLGRSYRMAFENLLIMKARADQLTDQLRAEKASADEARHQAEVANRAKTQFFAAASHDLRQPLHAMGLFAEALRQRTHDEEVTHLVNSINSSVDALDGLFCELLDITRIDTGGVDAVPEHFGIGRIFHKLRLHFEPSAFDKGLRLRFHGESHNAYADPLLVERVLRNLVSNAIRYTEHGGVLVSCRRRGSELLVQVRDTGCGIRLQDQQQVFEEFYQVAENAASGDQKKGLGLGLAIVRRLVGLMQAPLMLQSEPGRGTCFTLRLPVGKAHRQDTAALPAKGPPGLTLEQRLIVVVEDEPAVRGGLEVLLKGWGASVMAFEAVDACRAWARSAPELPAPDLLMVDYRLENGRTGLEAIEAMRARFGRRLPVIMITGSTMTGLETQAQVHGFHLLVKPVVPNKLRAMIAFKLGVRSR